MSNLERMLDNDPELNSLFTNFSESRAPSSDWVAKNYSREEAERKLEEIRRLQQSLRN